MSLRIKKNDRVYVLSGKDKGKEGKIIKVFPKEGRAIVEGINRIKRHTRPTPTIRQGGIIEREAPIYLCKLMLVCPNCGQPTRFFAGFDSNGNKVRICKKCKEIIDRKE
ncbi:TPA: 50S ribosomal protein L24 [bacterium]|nr:50S ribosomal protein L24 [bacterium]